MIVGISITKGVSFRGVTQEFSNVYHYELAGAVTGPWSDIVNEIKASEVAFHSVDVTFINARVWSAGGSPSQNQMLFQTNLSGTGSQTANASLDRERAILIRWPAGVDSRGHPVYLRKWYHCCGNCQNQSFAASILQNTAQIGSAARGVIASAAAAFDQVGVVEAWSLCGPSGRNAEGTAECHAYLEHHQLGDMWR